MDPDICFEPSIDFSTLKHLVTDVPDPPMAFMKPSWSAKQNNRCFSFRTLKHQIVDVPDPPLISGSACKIQECLQNIESGWSSILNYFFNTLNVAQYRNKTCGRFIFLYIYGGFCAFVDQCVQAGLRTENKYNKLTSQKTTTPWDKRSIMLLCFCICLPSSSCDDHVLSYYHSGWYWPEEGQFRFETVGYVDDREIDMYSSESQVNVAKTLWMEENESNNYWERQTSLRKGWEKVFKDNLKILASRFNYTRRLHTLQLGYGCELHNNHSITGHYQYGFDGKDFLVFDINSLLWYPGMQKAEISAQRWNTDRSIGEGVKLYLHEHCISALKKYIDYGRHELENRVVPKVKIRSSKSQNGTTSLQCLVYGFHPRAVGVKWVMNGVDDVPADEMSPILPHPDGTYQIRVSAEVPIREGDTYACHVDHSSLEETLSVIWVVESDDKTLVLVTVVVAVIVLLIALVSVALVLKKKSANLYKKVAINLMPF